jgi:hypothetical protein
VAHDLRHDLGEDLGVALEQVEPCFARLLADAARDHRHARARAVFITARPDARLVREGDGVTQVHRLALGPLAVLVNQHDLGGEAAQQQRVGERRADMARADDGHARRLSLIHLSPPGCSQFGLRERQITIERGRGSNQEVIVNSFSLSARGETVFGQKRTRRARRGKETLRVLFAPSCPSCPFLPFKRLSSPCQSENQLTLTGSRRATL